MASSSSQGRLTSRVIFFAAVPLAVSFLLIIKTFFIPGCYAFDANDDAGFTFLSLAAARRILSEGALPLVYLSHAFGTPVPGDCLTFPFAPQALTYAFLPGALAMTVNRFLLAWASLAVLTLYYRRRMELPWASLCAFLAFTTPGAFWNFAHHHYQAALLFAGVLLLLEERYIEKGRALDAALFYAAAVLMVQSLSIMIVLIAAFFLLANAALESGGEKTGRALRAALLLGAAFIFQVPEILSFAAQAAGSLRASSGFGIAISPGRMAAGILGGLSDFRHLHEAWIYLSFPLLAVLAGGAALRPAGVSRRKVFLLGVLPLAVVWVLLGWQRLYWAIPYVKATDITRIWWVSHLFLMAAAGPFLAGLWRGDWTLRQTVSFAALVFTAFLLSHLVVDYGRTGKMYWHPVFAFTAAVCTYAALRAWAQDAPEKAGDLRKIAAAVIVICVIAGKYPVLHQTLGLEDLRKCKVTHWFSPGEEQDYALKPLLSYMQTGSRVTHEVHMVYRHDAKINQYGMLGAQPVTPLHYRPLDEYLLREKLVERETDGYGLGQYHFVRPWNAPKLRDLGIRYVVQAERNPQAEAEGWKLLGNFQFLHLYENAEPAGLLYLSDGDARVALPPRSVRFRRNGVEADLPPLEKEAALVAAFADRPGWKARVDGEVRPLARGEIPLLRVMVGPGDRKAAFDYEPFGLAHVLACAVISMGLAFLILRRAAA